MRCFVSIELPLHIKANIVHAFEKLKTSGLVSGNFVARDNLHLTLKFLGDLTEERILEIENALKDINLEQSQFAVESTGIGFFPSEEYIRVIWVGLESEDIFSLQKIVEKKLEGIGIALDEKEFSLHITVARIKNVKDKDGFLKKVREMKLSKEFFTVDNVSLIKSELTKDGPVYKVIKEFPLRMEKI